MEKCLSQMNFLKKKNVKNFFYRRKNSKKIKSMIFYSKKAMLNMPL